jgi:hypothetical protein
MAASLTERDKMLRGEPYDSCDPELLAARFEVPFFCDYGAQISIGAGSVVTRPVPVGTVAAGNPCHAIARPQGLRVVSRPTSGAGPS